MLLQMMLFYSFHGSSVLSVLRTLHNVLHRGCAIYIPTSNVGGFPFLPPPFIVGGLFSDDHSDWCGIVPHYSFDLHFSDN